MMVHFTHFNLFVFDGGSDRTVDRETVIVEEFPFKIAKGDNISLFTGRKYYKIEVTYVEQGVFTETAGFHERTTHVEQYVRARIIDEEPS